MTDSCLVVTVVRAPKSIELAEHVRLLVVKLSRSQPVHRVRSGLLADLEHLIADLVNRLVPAHSHPFSADQLGRVFQAALAMAMFADRSTFCAMRAQVKWVVKSWLLADPDPVIYFGVDTAAYGTVGANRANRLGAVAPRGNSGLRLSHHCWRQRCSGSGTA